MATPRRRSSRLRGLSPQKLDAAANAPLTALDENDEIPTLNAPITTFGSPRCLATLATIAQTPTAASSVKTPTTGSRLRPSPEEMHPSRFQNTATKAASVKRLGIVNRQLCQVSSTNNQINSVQSPRPIVNRSPTRESFASPGFQFRFRQSTDLSTDAQRMMDEIREQAARIRDGLPTQYEEGVSADDEFESVLGRKLATPKGKMTRFSDVHMDQFKKMNSIADHASKFRAGHSTLPSVATKIGFDQVAPIAAPLYSQKATALTPKSLKRTNSKAELDKPETADPKIAATTAPEQQDDNFSPAKRFKQRHEDALEAKSDMQSAGIGSHRISASALPRSKTGIPTVPSSKNLMTPSKLPLARSASVKSLKTNIFMHTPQSHSSSTKIIATPVTTTRFFPHTEGNRKYQNPFVAKVKSILRQPNIRFSDDPAKIAADTHLSTPKGSSSKQELTFVPQQPPGTPAWRKEKHVNFSPSTVNSIDRLKVGTPTTPSPLKIPGSYPVLYPSLVASTALAPGTPTPIGLATTGVRASIAGPGDFTFRADKTINFGLHPGNTPTIRRVRVSDTTAFGGLSAANAASKDGLDQLPHVPHGLSNKKRKRDSADGTTERVGQEMQEDKENLEAEASDLEQRGSPAKKARVNMDLAPQSVSATPVTVKAPSMHTSKSKIPKRRGGSVLSLSRLNALARPKGRS